MAVFRVNKNKNYTVMSNYHFKDKNLSLKAKGLLSQMLSLPEDWDYTIVGLCTINKESEGAINSALKELKENGYLVIRKLMPNETKSGRIEYIYDIYEKPQSSKKQDLEKQGVDFQGLENSVQLNTNKLSTKELNKDNTIPKGIEKTPEKNINGVKFCEYCCQNVNGVLNKVEWGIKQSLTNNIEDNIEDNIDTIPKGIEQKAPKQFGNVEINELFDEWEKHCGFKIDTKVKQNRYACQRLLRSRGFERVKNIIPYVAESQADQYAPGINNFMDLAEKWNNLAVWYKKKKVTNTMKYGKIVIPTNERNK